MSAETEFATSAGGASPTSQLALPLWGLVLLGLAIGFVASMAGIGGGLFAVPALYMLWKLPLERSVATALVMVFATALASTATEALRADSEIRWALVLQMMVGALLGAQLGFEISRRISGRRLRQVFMVVLALAGARMLYTLFAPGADSAQLEHAHALEGAGEALVVAGWVGSVLPTWLIAAAIGFLGGVASPLLGIGGGLVMVPGLFFFLPSLGFGGARACALAVAVATASRSVWLHYRAGRTHLPAGLSLGLGALVGSTLGVRAFHLPGLDVLGQCLLVATLWIVAVRYWFELRATRP